MNRPSKQQGIRFIFPEVRRMMREGYSDEHIVSALIARGVNPEEARSVVGQLRESDASAVRSEIYRQIAIGAGIAILGMVLICGALSSASRYSSVFYAIAFVMILRGGWRFIRGVRTLRES